MGDLSAHFSRREFECRCGCGADTVDAELISVLEDLRAWAKTQNTSAVVRVNCGIRCKKHNAAVGGAKSSQHLLGKAADVVVRGLEPGEVVAYLDRQYPDMYGIGRYRTFTHVDVRRDEARWGE